MKQLINKLYKNQSLVYKTFLYILTTFFVVYLFPKGGKFQYEFQKGKPWQYETLIAPFDFPIEKTAKEIEAERADIIANADTYYYYDSSVVERVKNDFNEEFDELFTNDSIVESQTFSILKTKANRLLLRFYKDGVIATVDESKIDKLVILTQNNEPRTVSYNKFIKMNNLQNYINDFVTRELLENYETQLYSLFFDVIEPNVSINTEITNSELSTRLEEMAYTHVLQMQEKILEKPILILILLQKQQQEAMPIKAPKTNVMMIRPIIKKIPIMIIAMTLMFSCSKKDNLIIPNESVADFHLGQKLTYESYDKNSLEIILSNDNLIQEIIVLSDAYETKNGAKVGLTFAEVKEKQGLPLSEHLVIKKGNKYPFNKDADKPAEVLIYKGIIFFPEKNIDKVKSILVTNEPWH